MSDPHVWIRPVLDRNGDRVFVVGDEDGEFARAGEPSGAINYAFNLVYGPGVLKPGPLIDRAISEAPVDPA